MRFVSFHLRFSFCAWHACSARGEVKQCGRMQTVVVIAGPPGCEYLGLLGASIAGPPGRRRLVLTASCTSTRAQYNIFVAKNMGANTLTR